MNSAKPLSFVTLMFLTSFAAFGAMLPMALLPKIAQAFSISEDVSEGVMSWYLLGYALAQLLYGPLANGWGRRNALFMGAGIALLGSMLSVVSAHEGLERLYMFSRFLGGLGAGSGLIVGMVLIKDVYEKTQARKIFSRVVLTFSFVPFVAIAVGGLLSHYSTWQVLNWILLAYAALIVLLVCRLSETLALSARIKPSVKVLGKGYRHLLVNFGYLRFLMAFGLGSAISYTFNGVAPLWVLNSAHVSAQIYGYLSILPGIGLLVGGYMSQALAHQVSGYRMTWIGIGLMVVASVVLSIEFMTGHPGLVLFYAMAVILFCGQAIVAANAGMEAVSHVSDHANGTSLMNAMALLMGSVMVSVTGHLFLLHAAAFPIVLLGMAVLSVMIMLLKRS